MNLCSFKTIPGYEGRYLINRNGEVYSRWSEKILSCCFTRVGYFAVTLCNSKGQEKNYIHRLLAEVFIPNPENKRTVNHKNGIREDNRLNNLEWATYRENNVHALRLGLRIPPKGSKIGASKLKESDIPQIRYLLSKGEHTLEYIGSLFNVTGRNIGDIKRKRIWKHIKETK